MIEILGVLVLSATLPVCSAPMPGLTHGPFLGHAGPDEAFVWARASAGGQFLLEVTDSQRLIGSFEAIASPQNDLCMKWHVRGLEPARTYQADIHLAPPNSSGDAERDAPLGTTTLRTTPRFDAKTQTSLAFGSCANDREYPKQPIWPFISDMGAQGLVLLGDTPYIDSTAVAKQRERYRQFYGMPEIAAVLRTTPCWATWDDHDFGGVDAFGTLAGKEGSRQAFLEYHALASYGEVSEGIYTRFRFGPIEVFLIDTRWFAKTGPSPVTPDRSTLLGPAQWKWLTEGLARSTAPFKILASGMVWNDAVRPFKIDHWAAFAHERNALFRFLKEKRIGGVVLVGGDIHRTRVLRHKTSALAGYDLTELVTSPLANWAMKIADRPTPILIHDAPAPHSFMLVEVDATVEPPVLTARFLAAEPHAEAKDKSSFIPLKTRDGFGLRELFQVRLTTKELTPVP